MASRNWLYITKSRAEKCQIQCLLYQNLVIPCNDDTGQHFRYILLLQLQSIWKPRSNTWSNQWCYTHLGSKYRIWNYQWLLKNTTWRCSRSNGIQNLIHDLDGDLAHKFTGLLLGSLHSSDLLHMCPVELCMPWRTICDFPSCGHKCFRIRNRSKSVRMDYTGILFQFPDKPVRDNSSNRCYWFRSNLLCE